MSSFDYNRCSALRILWY